ncbi:MAG: chromate transporter [Bryobacterales bacterium]|nr:chromate transporter [Bryobacteraceae bacterium]MDW8353697.1 chromate transporter [Bryobacterales bacterium]
MAAQVTLKRLVAVALRVGNLTFGGGDPTMAAFHREIVTRRNWLTPEQYALAFGLARVTPGTNLLAFYVAVGWRLMGWRGALATVLAATTPSAAFAVLLTHSAAAWGANRWVTSVFEALSATAVGMTVATAWLLLRPYLRGRRAWRPLVFSGGAAILALGEWLSPVQIVGLAALAGLLWGDTEGP